MNASAPTLLQSAAETEGKLRVADIYAGDRLRDVDTAWAEALANQFDSRGQEQPIVVRRVADDEGIDQPYALVIGGHRYAAAELLGWDYIRAEVRDYGRLQARLAEIDENLFRHELNPLDRGIFLDARRRVWEELYPDTAHGGDRKSRQAQEKIKSQGLRLGPRRFTEDAAARCGLSERTVQASIALVAALTPETIALLRGTEIARNASELKRLADEPTDRQVAVARILRDGKAPTVAAARIAAGVAPTGEADPQEALFRSLVSGWARADKKTRARFLEHAGLVAQGRTR